jgi:hypothetical protein
MSALESGHNGCSQKGQLWAQQTKMAAYSITSSARPSSERGTVSASAVLRLMIRSTLMDCGPGAVFLLGLPQKRNSDPWPEFSRELSLYWSRSYFNEVLIDVNLVLRFVPMPFTTAMIASEMPAAISPYSIAVAPDWSSQNLQMSCFM